MSAPAPTPAVALERALDRGWERVPHAFDPEPVDVALRALDVVIAGAAGMLLSPVAGAVALAIRVTDGRPVLYRGARVGRGGRLFTMVKFRTLRRDAAHRLDPFLGPELTRLTEQEMTGVGRVVRATHLDELPQVLNVLRGDMSIVGPRPIRPTFFVELTEEIPAYWQRLAVRPGMTGFAQLRLTREMTWAEKLHHDFEFIADRSVGLYLRVVAATGVRVLARLALAAAGRAREVT